MNFYSSINFSLKKYLLIKIQAAEEFNVNVSTAKVIWKIYKKEGRIGKKKVREKKMNFNNLFH